MAIDFPASPTLNQSFTSAGVVYTWNGYAWSGGGPASAPFPHGQCRLIYVDANTIRLMPYNGNRLFIGNAVQAVPSAGVSLAVTGLTVGLVYYIYAWMNGLAMTLEASATGHSQDLATGVEIKTGDPSRTLVGMAFAQTPGPVWVDTDAVRGVRSWFNDPGFVTTWTLTVDALLNSVGVWAPLGTSTYFIPWQGEKITTTVQVVESCTVADTIALVGVGFNTYNTPAEFPHAQISAMNIAKLFSLSNTIHRNNLVEGLNFAVILTYHTAAMNFIKDRSAISIIGAGRP